MSVDLRPTTPDEVVGRVLRRVEVAKMTRKLQDRLALATYQTKYGLNGLSFGHIEAHVDKALSLKRRRTGSSVISSSDSSSSGGSDHQIFSSALAVSSPITAPVFSDSIYDSDLVMASQKRARFQNPPIQSSSRSSPRKSKGKRSMAPPEFEYTRQSWKSAHELSKSSPIQNTLHPDFRTANGPNLSFVSDVSTIPNSPPFGSVSDEEDNELPTHSFHVSTSSMRCSPPRTPPPTRTRILRNRKINGGGEEGADLLLYLATSPSPANPASKARVFPPSTPPSNHGASMHTPGGQSMFTGFSTPGQHFNFADFVNVTPSPAQGAFGNRTPGIAKTPLAAKEARRKLNFDNLLPPNGSPSTSRGKGNTGLGMELGGELMP